MPPVAGADILVADQNALGGTGAVIRVNPVTGARTTVSANNDPAGGPSFVDPAGLTLAPNGDILVVDPAAYPGAGGGVIRVNPVTGARTPVSQNAAPAGGPSFVDPFGIALAANGDILVTDQNAFGGGGGVIRVNPVTGARTAVSDNTTQPGFPNFDAPWGIDTEADGNIVVADPGTFGGGGGVIRVNPVTGVRTAVSENMVPTGAPMFADPIGLMVAANRNILVAEQSGFGGFGGVIRVTPVTGARTTLSANGAPPGGPAFGSAFAVAPAANGDVLLAGSTTSSPAGAIVRINPVTGARTRVSENSAPAGAPAFAFPTGIADAGTPETTISSGPPAETTDHSPTFSFSSSRAGSTFRCRLDHGPQQSCSSPFTTAKLKPGSHSFEVAATDATGNSDPTPAAQDFKVLAVLSDLKKPVLGRFVNVAPVKGKVTVAVPKGSSSARRARTSQKGLRFVPLSEARQIPVNSFLNTRKGTVRILAAGRGRQQSDSAGGLFQLRQARRGKSRGITELRLKGSSFKRCAARKSATRADASRRRLSRRKIRRLRGSGKGRFRTRGRYSSATVRGTAWTVTDRCDGTLTKVTRGVVAVRDFRRKKTVRLRAGHSYLAKGRR